MWFENLTNGFEFRTLSLAPGYLIVVDYKSTNKNGEVTLDDEWKESYKRQMEIYQWLLRQNVFRVSKTDYFVYANALKSPERFDGRLTFNIQLIGYEGNDGWIAPTLGRARECLSASVPPKGEKGCEWCGYREQSKGV